MKAQRRGEAIKLPAGAFALLAVLLIGSCKMGAPDYTLTVVLADGVIGTPAPGQYEYKELTQVTFSYTGADPLETVEVFLNDKLRYEGGAFFVMYGDGYTLNASLVDIRASYKITLTYGDSSAPAVDPFIITLTGANRLTGPFTDDRGKHGTWTAQSNVLALAYWDWEFYVLSGTVYGMGYSSGTFTGGGYSGTWTAVKQ
jgi:hypothetical protein